MAPLIGDWPQISLDYTSDSGNPEKYRPGVIGSVADLRLNRYIGPISPSGG
jgi:hypothetical protein